MICPDCKHEAQFHNFDGCKIGDCICNKIDAEIYHALLTEAKQVLEPLKERYKRHEETAKKCNFVGCGCEFCATSRTIIDFLKKLEDSTANPA